MDDAVERAFAAEDEGREDEALAILEEAAAAGSAAAMAELAMRIDDVERSDELVQRSADLGDPTGMWLQGVARAADGDEQAAAAWWTRAAAAGSPFAAFELGDLAWSAGDEDRAIDLWEQAAEGGAVRALTALGFVAKQDGDLENARELWTEAAECGHARAMFHLAHLDLDARDRASAEQWMAKAAQGRDPDAMLEYGGMALTAGELDVTVEWWMGAALEGNDGGKVNLVMLATHGRADAVEALRIVPGGEEELARTVEAAEAGGVPAMVVAGVTARLDGDDETADRFLARAEAEGNAVARFLLRGGAAPPMPTGYFRRPAEHLMWS